MSEFATPRAVFQRVIDGVTALDIWRVAKELFGRERWLIVALGDFKKSELKKFARR